MALQRWPDDWYHLEAMTHYPIQPAVNTGYHCNWWYDWRVVVLPSIVPVFCGWLIPEADCGCPAWLPIGLRPTWLHSCCRYRLESVLPHCWFVTFPAFILWKNFHSLIACILHSTLRAFLVDGDTFIDAVLPTPGNCRLPVLPYYHSLRYFWCCRVRYLTVTR